jgi:hypothetical protein
MDNTIYLDMGNDAWECIRITAAGWEVITEPGVKFRRPRGMRALPRPVPGSLLDLRPYINATDEESWRLMIAWLIAAMRPTGPYPVLSLLGEQGSAKTTTAEVFKRLLDPSKAPVRSEPRDVQDLMIAATNGWIVAFDNLSQIPGWLSDALCRMATGGGFSTRELYTDGDEVIFDTERPVIVTGIEEVVVRGDLLDRAVLVTLPPIPDSWRRPEATFWGQFEAARPSLLGGLLDAVSTAIRRAPSVRLTELPRMADFAIWTTAAASALGWSESDFLSTYAGNRATAHEVALEASPVAPLVRELVESGTWEGTAGELLEKLNAMASDATRRLKSWPATGRTLAGVLRRMAPSLRKVGVAVEFRDERDLGRRRRQIRLSKSDASERSHRSDGSCAGFPRSSGNDGNDEPISGTIPGMVETPVRNCWNDGNDRSSTQSERPHGAVTVPVTDEEAL